MNAWIETFLAALIAGLAGIAGLRVGRRAGHCWMIVFGISFAFCGVIGVAHRRPDWLVEWPCLSWIGSGRCRFILAGALVGLMLAPLVPRIPRPRDRRVVVVFALIAVLHTGVWPSLAAAILQPKLARLVTQFDADGICRQSTDFTCGPAAAVTALKHLDVDATESELAIAAKTSAATGTPPDVLLNVLNRIGTGNQFKAKLRSCSDIKSLQGRLPALALVRFSFLVDHWAAVLQIADERVTLGDPFRGKREMTHAEFAAEWKNVAITFSRSDSEEIRIDGGVDGRRRHKERKD